MFFFESFSNPLKSTFGAHLVLNWCQNDPQKWACLGARRHQKTILCKKPENSNPFIIYNTLSMSTPPKTPPFWSLKSYKIKEKRTLKTNLKKTLKNIYQFTFSCNFDSQNGSPRGGSSKSLFPLVFESWADLGTPGVPTPKMVPRASWREPKVTSGGYFLKLFGVDF